MSLPMTPVQSRIMAGLEAAVVRALRDREVAVTMLLAGHDVSQATLEGFDVQAGTIRISVPEAVTNA